MLYLFLCCGREKGGKRGGRGWWFRRSACRHLGGDGGGRVIDASCTWEGSRRRRKRTKLKNVGSARRCEVQAGKSCSAFRTLGFHRKKNQKKIMCRGEKRRDVRLSETHVAPAIAFQRLNVERLEYPVFIPPVTHGVLEISDYPRVRALEVK